MPPIRYISAKLAQEVSLQLELFALCLETDLLTCCFTHAFRHVRPPVQIDAHLMGPKGAFSLDQLVSFSPPFLYKRKLDSTFTFPAFPLPPPSPNPFSASRRWSSPASLARPPSARPGPSRARRVAFSLAVDLGTRVGTASWRLGICVGSSLGWSIWERGDLVR